MRSFGGGEHRCTRLCRNVKTSHVTRKGQGHVFGNRGERALASPVELDHTSREAGLRKRLGRAEELVCCTCRRRSRNPGAHPPQSNGYCLADMPPLLANHHGPTRALK